jgi:IclR family transcriptional regulator, KDG regulon repressor
MNVLNCFSQKQTKLSLGEISEKLSMEPSTVRRILLSLEEGGFIKQDLDSRKYSLGIELIRLGSTAMQNIEFREIAYPIMKKLSDVAKENVYLGITSGKQIIYIEIVEFAQVIGLTGSVGSARPLISTGIGKVLLANMVKQEVERILVEENLTDQHIISLLNEINEIKRNGITVVIGDYHKDIYSIAAPIYDRNQTVIASIAISGPTYRLDEDKIQHYKKLILETSFEISKQLGYEK